MFVNQLSDEYVKQLIITQYTIQISTHTTSAHTHTHMNFIEFGVIDRKTRPKSMVKRWIEENMGHKHTTPHQDFKYILLTAQFFGVLPVEGVLHDGDVNKLKFKWCTIKVFYSIFLTIPTFLVTALALYRVSQEETDAISKISKYYIMIIYKMLFYSIFSSCNVLFQ